MKILKNHTILYDAECPMCNLYTSGFIHAGMLDGDGRRPYQQLAANTCPNLDMRRAVNEIALVDNQTGEVSYGINSLFKVIAWSFPVFKPLFSFKPFMFIMNRVYAFVSYNRRVFVPGERYDYLIQPAFKLHYRVAYLLFTWFLTSLVLTHYAPLLSGVIPSGGAFREYFICGGQIIFQAFIISLFADELKWAYLGNMMTVSFGGSLLLLPGLLLGHWLTGQPLIFTAYFMLVAGLMFLEHIRRCKLLGLGWVLSTTWVAYRLFVLWIILK